MSRESEWDHTNREAEQQQEMIRQHEEQEREHQLELKRESDDSKLRSELYDLEIEEGAKAAGMSRDEYETMTFILFSLFFIPGLLGILGQKILHSVPYTTFVPISIPLTVGIATYAAWIAGKNLRKKNKLRVKLVWILPIRACTFLLTSSLIYLLFYRYDVYNSLCSLILPIYAIAALVWAILFSLIREEVNGQEDRKPEGTIPSNSRLPAASQSKNISSPPGRDTVNHFKTISFLFYAGIIMALVIQIARMNSWSLPLFKSYGDAFSLSLFLVALGAAHTTYIWRNIYVSLGIFLTTVGGFAWEYKWVFPVFKTYEVPLYIGIFLVLYGAFPQFLGIPLVVGGSLLLLVELGLLFTQGLAAVHYGNLIVSILLLGLSSLMFYRHKSLNKSGVFRNK